MESLFGHDSIFRGFSYLWSTAVRNRKRKIPEMTHTFQTACRSEQGAGSHAAPLHPALPRALAPHVRLLSAHQAPSSHQTGCPRHPPHATGTAPAARAPRHASHGPCVISRCRQKGEPGTMRYAARDRELLVRPCHGRMLL